MRKTDDSPDVRGTIPGSSRTGDSQTPVMGSPLPLPETTGAVPQASAKPPARSNPLPAARVPALPGATPDEVLLQGAIAQAGLGSDVLVGPVTIDPRQGSANIVLTLAGATSAEALSSRLPAIALRAAQAAFTRNNMLMHASLNIRADFGGMIEPMFSGEIDRRTAESVDTDRMQDGTDRLFTDLWYAPSINNQPLQDQGSLPDRM